MTKTQTDRQIADFIAARGVRQIALGETNGLTARAWHTITRAARTEIDDNDLVNQRIVTCGRIVNGLGETIAMDPHGESNADFAQTY
jgi:hypothetical protein